MLCASFLLALTAFAASPAEVPARAVIDEGFVYRGGPVKVLLLDADQTVRISSAQWRAPRAPGDVVILPNVPETIAEYERRGYFVAVMSNQVNAVNDTGLARIDETMRETLRQIGAGGGRVNYYDFAAAREEAKPGRQMVERLEAALRARFGAGASIDRAESLMVGDAAYLPGELRPDGTPGLDTANFDRRFAENNGVKFKEPQDFFGWKRQGVERIRNVRELGEYRDRVKRAGCPALFTEIGVR